MFKNFIKKLTECNSCCKPFTLAIIQVGNDPIVEDLINLKVESYKACGIQPHVYWYENTITTEALMLEIKDLQPHYSGIVV